MILTAHQPTYLPWLGLFHKIALSDAFVFFDHVQYSKKQYYNRNTIKTQHGPLTLSVPVVTSGKSRETMLHEAMIAKNSTWRRDHWKAIELAYRKAPYFAQYAPFFKEVYEKDWDSLADLDRTILKKLLEFLDIKVKWLEWDDIDPHGEKSDLVLDMCVKAGCTHYIFGAQGEEYADVQAFKDAGVTPYFQEYKHPEYSQQFPQLGFLPYMSVIDLLFNEGPRSKGILLSGNATREDVLASSQ